MKNEACKTPKQDLMVAALNHYEEAASAIHHWNSDIPKAIRKYYFDQETVNLKEINAKQSELIANIKIGYPTPLSKTAKRLESEIQALQAGEEIIEIDINDPELNEPI